MTVNELTRLLNKMPGEVEARFSNRDISSPILAVTYRDGAQFVVLEGADYTPGGALSIAVSDGVVVSESIG